MIARFEYNHTEKEVQYEDVDIEKDSPMRNLIK